LAAVEQRGISYLLLEVNSPGIEVRPLVNMAGSHEFNEIFFQDVHVPRKQLVGEMNRGWYVGMATMDFERSAIGSVAGVRRDLEDLAAEIKAAGPHVAERCRYDMADRAVEAEVSRFLSLRILSMQVGGAVPNYEASIAKLFTPELNQRVARTGLRIGGLAAQVSRTAMYAGWARAYLQTVASTIAGGTSEIQRNIIATRGLGLPRG
jgi:alkylation response protein AidB-like acyl-CoA dehydrogenase